MEKHTGTLAAIYENVYYSAACNHEERTTHRPIGSEILNTLLFPFCSL